jgi:hypothetical protein
LKSGSELLEPLQRSCPVTGKHQAAHSDLYGRFGGRVETERAGGNRGRLRSLPSSQQVTSVMYQDVHRPQSYARAFARQPVLELRRSRDGEPFEKFTGDQPGRPGPVTGSGQLLEALDVESHGSGREPHLAGRRIDVFVPQIPTKDSDGLIERVAGRSLGLFSPEKPDQVLAGTTSG